MVEVILASWLWANREFSIDKFELFGHYSGKNLRNVEFENCTYWHVKTFTVTLASKIWVNICITTCINTSCLSLSINTNSRNVEFGIFGYTQATNLLILL